MLRFIQPREGGASNKNLSELNGAVEKLQLDFPIASYEFLCLISKDVRSCVQLEREDW